MENTLSVAYLKEQWTCYSATNNFRKAFGENEIPISRLVTWIRNNPDHFDADDIAWALAKYPKCRTKEALELFWEIVTDSCDAWFLLIRAPKTFWTKKNAKRFIALSLDENRVESCLTYNSSEIFKKVLREYLEARIFPDNDELPF